MQNTLGQRRSAECVTVSWHTMIVQVTSWEAIPWATLDWLPSMPWQFCAVWSMGPSWEVPENFIYSTCEIAVLSLVISFNWPKKNSNSTQFILGLQSRLNLYNPVSTRWSGCRVQVWVQVWAPAGHLAITPEGCSRRQSKISSVIVYARIHMYCVEICMYCNTIHANMRTMYWHVLWYVLVVCIGGMYWVHNRMYSILTGMYSIHTWLYLYVLCWYYVLNSWL